MAKILRHPDFSMTGQLAKAHQNYPQFLMESEAMLKIQLADAMLESRDHPEIDEILKLIAFVREEIREYHENSKRS